MSDKRGVSEGQGKRIETETKGGNGRAAAIPSASSGRPKRTPQSFTWAAGCGPTHRSATSSTALASFHYLSIGAATGSFRAVRVKSAWQKFALKVAAWVVAALAVHFLTTIFLGGPPDYVVPGILLLGALQIGLLDRTPLPADGGKILKRGVALLMAAFAVWIGTNPGLEEKISWQSYSDEALVAARRGGRPVMIDFTSRNCPPCLEMERKVFTHRRVAEAAKDFLPLRADLTSGDATAQALAGKFGIEAFPTIVFVGADGKERSNLRLVGYENATFFAERVESAR
jgi:thiol:disulfide interchange protein DsbD